MIPGERWCWPRGGSRGQKTQSSALVRDCTWGVRQAPRMALRPWPEQQPPLLRKPEGGVGLGWWTSFRELKSEVPDFQEEGLGLKGWRQVPGSSADGSS